MAIYFGFGIKDGPRPIKLAVILKLKRVPTNVGLSWTNKAAEGLLIVFNEMHIICIGCIARHDEKHGNERLT